MGISNYKSLIVLAFLISVVQIGAQNVFQPKPIEYNLLGIVYDTETAYDVRIHTQGFSFGIKKGKLKTYYRTTYQGIEFGYMKDGRERRQNKNLTISGERLSSSFIYGKQSQFFAIRGFVGEKIYLSEKTRRKGVAVGFNYEGGASLGLIKPYYLKVIRLGDDNLTRTVETIRYTDETHDDYINYQNIYGGTQFFKGFTAISPAVGLHGKLGMHWALGAFEKQVKAIEAGVFVDIYTRNIPLLVEREDINNNFIFAKLYLAFQFGSRKRAGE